MGVQTRKHTGKRGFPVKVPTLMEAIGKKGMSMEALAKQADVDRTTIYNLQKGKNASPEVLKNLSNCLGVRIEDLVMDPKDVLKAKRKLVKDHIGRANPEEVEVIWDFIYTLSFGEDRTSGTMKKVP